MGGAAGDMLGQSKIGGKLKNIEKLKSFLQQQKNVILDGCSTSSRTVQKKIESLRYKTAYHFPIWTFSMAHSPIVCGVKGGGGLGQSNMGGK